MYGSLGKTVLQHTLSAELVAEEYPKVSLANKAGDCFFRNPACSGGMTLSKIDAILVRSKRSRSL